MTDSPNLLGKFAIRSLTERVTRRSFIHRAAVLGVAVPTMATLLAACAEDDDELVGMDPEDDDTDEPDETDVDDDDVAAEGDPDEDDDDTVPTAEEDGGTLVTDRYQGTPNPWQFSGTGDWICLIFEPLVTVNGEYNYDEMMPALAEDWEASEDGVTWTFNLRTDVAWHDGEPFTTDDVVFSFTTLLHPEMTGWMPEGLRNISGARAYNENESDEVAGIMAIDDHTLELTLEGPTPFNLQLENLSQVLIQPEHRIGHMSIEELSDDPYFTTELVGTGPFKFEEMETEQYQVLVRNDDYWRGAPQLDSIVTRQIEEVSVKILSLESGEVDLISLRAPEDFATLTENPEINAWVAPEGIMNEIRVGREPNILAEDKRVRQAIYYAIDRDAINEAIYDGEATVTNSQMGAPWVPKDHLNQYEYDPDMARSLLDEAGWDSSVEMELLSYYVDQVTTNILTAIQQYLSDVGIQTTIHQASSADLGDVLDTHRFGLVYGGRGSGYVDDPSNTAIYFAYGGYGAEPSWFQDSRVDELYDQGRSEPDENRRAEIYAEIAEILNEELPTLPFWASPRYFAQRNTVQNIEGNLGQQLHIPIYTAAETWSKED
jgi:peptide/nickel transport system substrate-binding protein